MNTAFSKKLNIALLSLLIAISMVFCGSEDDTDNSPLKVGVMLPLTGDWALGYQEPLEWAVRNVNNAGGVRGRKIELVYKDVGQMSYAQAATELVSDPDVVAVIGTDGSTSTFDLATLFIEKKVPLVTPAATSAEIYRAFAGSGYIWRTVESDIAQVRTMLLLAARKGYNRVSVIASTDVYGSTFFDWFGFFATELQMNIRDVIRYDQEAESCERYIQQAVSGNPEMIFLVPSDPITAVCMVRAFKETGSNAKILFSDGGTYTSIIDNLGEDAEGLEGVSLASDPRSGFDIAYEVEFDELPPPYAHNVYDALLIIAYGLQRSEGKGGAALSKGMADVVDAEGTRVGWDDQGVRQALDMIESGNLPDITGGTGELRYDLQFHTDLVASTYGYWRVEYGEFVTVEYLSSDDSNNPRTSSGISIFRTLASEAAKQQFGGFADYSPPAKTGLWAFVMAFSEGWENYRHQADALGFYQMLKANGIDDDHIVLIMADDIANNPANPKPGKVFNTPGGPDVYAGAQIDYRLSEVDLADINDILTGDPRMPVSIQSGPSDNVFVFLVGHGSDGGIGFAGTLYSPSRLASAISEMYGAGKYRRLLVAIEACFGGSFGVLSSMGSLLISGANGFENSFGANYDNRLDVWLADQFASQFLLAAKGDSAVSLFSLYEDLYLKVNGSHVSVFNSSNFGDIGSVNLREFITP